MHPSDAQAKDLGSGGCHEFNLYKKINSEKDVIYFKSKSLAFKNIVKYVDLLCERIHGTSTTVYNRKYILQNGIFKKCSEFLHQLEVCCDETDLNLASNAGTLRFGHVAYRTWFDKMKTLCKEFIDELAASRDDQFRSELSTYLAESFGNRMRIDYGTGHELNFIIFTLGLCKLAEEFDPTSIYGDARASSIVSHIELKGFVEAFGWDIHSLFAQNYLRLCRKLQTKFRLEPAGSRGVYNMDDFQFLPFLFGAAQLSGYKYISTGDFYNPDGVDMFKNDYIFFEALDFILSNKRGPFNEHSYTLWGFTNLGTWENIYRRIKSKFIDDILSPFPIAQHLLFGEYILRWADQIQDSGGDTAAP